MTLRDVYNNKSILVADVDTYRNTFALNANEYYDIFLANYLFADFDTELRYTTEQAFKNGFQKWILKANDFQNEYEKYITAIKLDEQTSKIQTTTTATATTSGSNENQADNINETAGNPSINQAQAFDNLPYVQSQNRGKANSTSTSQANNDSDSTTSYGTLDFTEKLVAINPPELINIFNRNMRYIWFATSI